MQRLQELVLQGENEASILLVVDGAPFVRVQQYNTDHCHANLHTRSVDLHRHPDPHCHIHS